MTDRAGRGGQVAFPMCRDTRGLTEAGAMLNAYFGDAGVTRFVAAGPCIQVHIYINCASRCKEPRR